jgi:hypothetical protein
MTLFRLSFTKIPSAWVRAMRQNQRIIRRDACHTTEAARRAGKDALKELLNKLFT